MTWWQRFNKSSAHTQANIVCTILIMIATGAYSLVAAFQLKAMRHTNELTEAALGNAGRSSEESRRQFLTQLQHFDASLGVNQLQLGKLDFSIAQASRLAKATERANANILNSDRPWMGGTLIFDQPIAVNNSPTAFITFTNSGRRPGRVTSILAKGGIFTEFPKNPPYDRSVNRSKSFLVPGAPIQSKLKLLIGGDGKINQGLLDSISGKSHYFIYAEILYIDPSTNISHHTHACWQYFPENLSSPSGFYNCTGEDSYQDAD